MHNTFEKKLWLLAKGRANDYSPLPGHNEKKCTFAA